MSLSNDDLHFLNEAGKRLEYSLFEDALKPLQQEAKAGDKESGNLLELLLLCKQLQDNYQNEQAEAFRMIGSLMRQYTPALYALVNSSDERIAEFVRILDLAGLFIFAMGYRFYRDNQD